MVRVSGTSLDTSSLRIFSPLEHGNVGPLDSQVQALHGGTPSVCGGRFASESPNNVAMGVEGKKVVQGFLHPTQASIQGIVPVKVPQNCPEIALSGRFIHLDRLDR